MSRILKGILNEAPGDIPLDPETALFQARKITSQYKYADMHTDIIMQMQRLAEKAGIDPKSLDYYIDEVMEKQRELESAIFNLEEPFEDAVREQQYKDDDLGEGQIYSTGGGPGEPLHWYKPRHVPNQDELQRQSGILEGLQKVKEGTDQEKYTGGAKGLPFPGTYEQEYNPFKRKGTERIIAMTNEEQIDEKWSEKYKRSINCSNPKGFSQKAHCQGRKK